jgi:IclR family acetate operon transcriptional repressor
VAAKRVDAMLPRAHLNSLRSMLITRDALMDDLRETQPRGWSFDGEEKNIGTRCTRHRF